MARISLHSRKSRWFKFNKGPERSGQREEKYTKRAFGEVQSDWQKKLEPWIADGVPGHIELVTSPFFNASTTDRRPLSSFGHGGYDPDTTFTDTFIYGIRGNTTSYSVGEIGYTRAVDPEVGRVGLTGPYLMYAKSVGSGAKFWMLKSHDLDCLGGGEKEKNYVPGTGGTSDPWLGPNNGTEYPVTLRSPFGNDKYYGVYAYCATYDPNPRGSTMRLGAAPCGRIACASGPPEPGTTSTSPSATPTPKPFVSNTDPYDHEPIPDPPPDPVNLDPFVPAAAHNPDGTVAPAFFTTRPCNYLDPNCHVSQVFLYNSLTGTIRPMYNPGGMEGYNEAHVRQRRRGLGGPDVRQGALRRGVVMVFRMEEGRQLNGWPEPDPALVVVDPAFDRRTEPQPELPEPIEWSAVEADTGNSKGDGNPRVDDPYPLPWWEEGAETGSGPATNSTMEPYLGPDPDFYVTKKPCLGPDSYMFAETGNPSRTSSKKWNQQSSTPATLTPGLGVTGCVASANAPSAPVAEVRSDSAVSARGIAVTTNSSTSFTTVAASAAGMTSRGSMSLTASATGASIASARSCSTTSSDPGDRGQTTEN